MINVKVNEKHHNRGFTLAELLIVVAIIAVLVAIAIPIFTNQLEKSREATDLANCRTAYGELIHDYLANGTGSYVVVRCTQTKEGWNYTEPVIGSIVASSNGKKLKCEGDIEIIDGFVSNYMENYGYYSGGNRQVGKDADIYLYVDDDGVISVSIDDSAKPIYNYSDLPDLTPGGGKTKDMNKVYVKGENEFTYSEEKPVIKDKNGNTIEPSGDNIYLYAGKYYYTSGGDKDWYYNDGSGWVLIRRD